MGDWAELERALPEALSPAWREALADYLDSDALRRTAEVLRGALAAAAGGDAPRPRIVPGTPARALRFLRAVPDPRDVKIIVVRDHVPAWNPTGLAFGAGVSSSRAELDMAEAIRAETRPLEETAPLCSMLPWARGGNGGSPRAARGPAEHRSPPPLLDVETLAERGVLWMPLHWATLQGSYGALADAGLDALADAVLRAVARATESRCVVLVWGASVRAWARADDRLRELGLVSIETSHPNARTRAEGSAPFVGSRCFAHADAILEARGRTGVLGRRSG